jgi:N-glycosidase YbiA
MDPIEFSSKGGQREFSNFWPASFLLDDKRWPTVEHYFQAKKFPTDPSIQEIIRSASSPFLAKRLGRTCSVHFDAAWEDHKEDIMKMALLAKFTQNPELSTLLLATGSRPLIENAYWDAYWGSGRTGKGKNRMGHLLSEVRENLRTVSQAS